MNVRWWHQCALVFCFFLCFLSNTMAAGVKYPLRFLRPYKPGDKFLVTGSGVAKRRMVYKRGRRVFKSKRFNTNYRYKAVLTILAVHRHKQPSQEMHKILRFQKKIGGRWMNVFSVGTFVLGKAIREKRRFTVNGYPVSKDEARLLKVFSRLTSASMASVNSIFKTSGMKRIGQSWGVNPVVANSFLTDSQYLFKPKYVRGKTRLTKLRTVNGLTCLQLDGWLKVYPIHYKVRFRVKKQKGFLKLWYRGYYPLSPARQVQAFQLGSRSKIEVVQFPVPGMPPTRLLVTARVQYRVFAKRLR